VVFAQPARLAAAADAIEGGLDPQGEEDARVDGGCPRGVVGDPDGGEEGGEVEPGEVVPERPDGMLRWQELVERLEPHLHLIADGEAEALGGHGSTPRVR